MPLSHLPARARPNAAVTEASRDWLDLWALSLGASASAIAAVAYFAGLDAVGAAGILAAAALLIGVMLYSARPRGADR